VAYTQRREWRRPGASRAYHENGSGAPAVALVALRVGRPALRAFGKRREAGNQRADDRTARKPTIARKTPRATPDVAAHVSCGPAAERAL
jgi:hypothetical protein